MQGHTSLVLKLVEIALSCTLMALVSSIDLLLHCPCRLSTRASNIGTTLNWPKRSPGSPGEMGAVLHEAGTAPGYLKCWSVIQGLLSYSRSCQQPSNESENAEYKPKGEAPARY